MIDLQTKLLWDVFAPNYFGFKVYQFCLFIIFLLALRNLAKQLSLTILGIGVLLAIIISSRAIHDAFLWWVNMGQGVFLICFVVLMNFLVGKIREGNSFATQKIVARTLIYSVLSFLAIFSKETGIVVLAGFVYLSFLERNRLSVILLLAVFALFVATRVLVVGQIAGSDPFMASSGLGLTFLSSDELRVAFDNNKYIYYFYNIASQFLYVFFKQPVNGQFMFNDLGVREFSNLIYIVAMIYLLASAICRGFSRRSTFIIFILTSILLNSILSFPYARERIMNVADISFAVMAALMASNLLAKKSFVITSNGFFGGMYGLKIASICIVLISFGRGLRRYYFDCVVSFSDMRGFIVGDYTRILDGPGAMPSMVSQNVIDGLGQHYRLILDVVDGIVGSMITR